MCSQNVEIYPRFHPSWIRSDYYLGLHQDLHLALRPPYWTAQEYSETLNNGNIYICIHNVYIFSNNKNTRCKTKSPAGLSLWVLKLLLPPQRRPILAPVLRVLSCKNVVIQRTENIVKIVPDTRLIMRQCNEKQFGLARWGWIRHVIKNVMKKWEKKA